MEKIAFIGLGNMGLPMARLLIEAGYPLRVYNRSKEKAESLPQDKITLCETPREAAEECTLIITMLADDKILNEAVSGADGFASALQKELVHISMSTIAPETSQLLAEQHAGTGAAYVAAPVFGRPDAAAAKKLWICVSGKNEVKERVKPVLRLMGQDVIDFGEDPGAANVVKILGNFMILSSLEMMGEAFALGEKFGLERTAIADFFGSTVFNAPVYKNYGKLLASRQFEPVGFRSRLALKDVRLALSLARELESPMPLGSLIQDRLLSAMAKNRGDRDMVEAFERGISDDAGIQTP